MRKFGSCLNNNNHLETVRETISENSASVIESSIDVKDVKKENEILDKGKLLVDKKEKLSEYDKNFKNTFGENERSTCTEHNNNINNIVLNEKFKYYDLFLHNNTKKTSPEIKTDSLL